MRLLIILTLGSILWSCEKQREQVEKFVFDSKQISTRDIHRYEFYADGKIKVDYSVSYVYMGGVPIDSTISREYYQYNNTGKIVSITDLTDSTNRIKLYNELDSLIADYSINSWGDTTLLYLFDYKNGKVIREVNRTLTIKSPENIRDMKLGDFRNYDTLLLRTDLIYEGDVHTKSLAIDERGDVTEEIHFLFEGSKQTKTIIYSFLGDAKYVKETTTFLENGSEEPDLLTIGTQGDTIAFKKTIYQDDQRIVINYMGELNTQDIWYYNKNSKLIGTVLLNLNEKTKTVYSFSYDNNGNLMEETSYTARMNNAR